MRSEVRREAISLLLGDLREFQNYTGQLHLCEWQTSEKANSLVERISKKIKIKERGVEESLRLEWKRTRREAKSFVELLFKLIPQDYFNSYSNTELKVKCEKWDDWLQICWGHDHDTLSMLSIIPSSNNRERFLESVEKLPIIQSPALKESNRQVIFDHHTHSGALYPPSLQWAHWINTGINYRDFVSEKNYSEGNLNGYKLSHEKINEHRERSKLSHGYLVVARVLLGTMLDFYQISSSLKNDGAKNDVTKDDVAKCSELMDKVSKMVYENDAVTREELASLLKEYLPELNNSSLKYLEKSIESAENFEEEVYSFLKEERKCIAYLLWNTYKSNDQHQNNKLGIFIQEVLLTYLRCKGAWFQINSGNNLKELDPSDHLVLKIDDLSNFQDDNKIALYLKVFHLPMLEALKKIYGNTNSPNKLEVRLPFMDRKDINRNIDLCTSMHEKVDFVLSFPRYNIDDNINKWGNCKKAYLDFIEHILDYIHNINSDEENKNFRVIGVDLVGTNQSINWHDYANFIPDMRKKILEAGNQSCFVTYHLDEEKKVFALKEICEILTILKTGKLQKYDRISHGWSLLIKADQYNQTDTITMYREEWDLIETRLNELKDTLTPEGKQIVAPLSPVKFKDNYAVLNAKVMSEVAEFLQPHVRKLLINQDILLEVCPTSSWRVAGISLPTQHPVKSWIQAGGKYLVGTDNPAVFPCTIESEYYLIQRLMEQSGMYDVFLAHNSQDKKQVQAIASQLQNRGFNPWLDDAEIQPGRLFQDEIQEAISRVKSAAIFIGSDGLGKWQEVEWRSLMSQFVERKIPLIPVLLPGVNNFDNLPINLLFLKQFRGVFFSSVTNDNNALDLLEWGITGKKPNIIQQEEKPGRVPTQEDVQTISPSTSKVSGEGKCSCVDELEKLTTVQLRRRIEKRLQSNNIKAIWFDTFQEVIDSPKREEIEDRVIDLINRADQERKISTLIESLCEQRSDLEKP